MGGGFFRTSDILTLYDAFFDKRALV